LKVLVEFDLESEEIGKIQEVMLKHYNKRMSGELTDKEIFLLGAAMGIVSKVKFRTEDAEEAYRKAVTDFG
jgi:uncharacterized protein YjbJ (UPF0337 family)